MTDQINKPVEPPPAPPPAVPPPARTFTQAELETILGERLSGVSKTKETEILAKLGFKSLEEVTVAITEAAELKKSQMSELEKLQADLKVAQDKVVTAETEKTTALAQASEKLLKAAVLAEAVAANFRPEAVNDVWLIVDRSKIKEKDGDFEGVKEAVALVGTAKPFWLKAEEKPKPQGTPKPGDKKLGDKPTEPPVRVRF